MEEISKKDLLVETGISYGQLYRWKRDGLIPEEWFIKRSAFTGQETFFPRDRMLARINGILALKDTHSLEEIRESLVNKAMVHRVFEALRDMSDMEPDFLRSLKAPTVNAELCIESIAAIIGLYEMAIRAGVERDRMRELIDEALAAVAESTQTPTMVALVKAADTWHYIMASGAAWIAIDRGITFVETRQVADIVERIRIRINQQN